LDYCSTTSKVCTSDALYKLGPKEINIKYSLCPGKEECGKTLGLDASRDIELRKDEVCSYWIDTQGKNIGIKFEEL